MEIPILSVSEVTSEIKEVLEETFDDVLVMGEISNFKRHSSGHLYFTLKDAGAQLSGVMWSFVARQLYFAPQDGMQVVVRGAISVYQPRGTYQISAKSMQPAGEGALFKAFEKLKKRLFAEGLFDERLKKPLPEMPKRIGIVTSDTGAAIRDLLTIIGRRFPMAEVVICPVKVQGAGAAEEIAKAIYTFNFQPNRPDVMIVGRGGGNIEDLWAFNEEIVARAIFHSEIPIISAVGHETDVTIADFVADVRAATPSMAAELATPDAEELRQYVETLQYTAKHHVRQKIQAYHTQLQTLTQSYSFHRPILQLSEFKNRLEQVEDKIKRGIDIQIMQQKTQIEHLNSQLLLLNPLLPLERGFVQVLREKALVTKAEQLEKDNMITLRFIDGEHRAQIKDAD